MKKAIVCMFFLGFAISLPLAWAIDEEGNHGIKHKFHYHDSDIKHRIDQQERRIRKDLDRGIISEKEAHKLYKNMDTILRYYYRSSRDRKLSDAERSKLHRLLDENEYMIFQAEHNGKKR